MESECFMFAILFAVPPHQLFIYDSSGVQVERVAGPFQVGVEFGLSCEVRGGKLSCILIRILGFVQKFAEAYPTHLAFPFASYLHS